MAEEMNAVANTSDNEVVLRIYEVGYHIVPTVVEENVEKAVGDIRSAIEKAGGSFIAEGAPAMTRLAYEMESQVGDKRSYFDKAYFGWIKYEAPVASVAALEEFLKANTSILRHIIFVTVREETRAKIKAPTLREVKRTDTIKSTPRRPEETSAPLSEVDLDKALLDITE
ncbi:MAG: Ribosomal protein [Candidatus Kaiserbacteria bacterium]|nr:Ribosomal protein [Candidatus Kaiserbacteria bacterium]